MVLFVVQYRVSGAVFVSGAVTSWTVKLCSCLLLCRLLWTLYWEFYDHPVFYCVQNSFSCVLLAGFFHKLVYLYYWLGYVNVIYVIVTVLSIMPLSVLHFYYVLGRNIEVNVAATISLFCIIFVNWWISGVVTCKLHILNLPKQNLPYMLTMTAGLYFYMHACQSVMKDMLFC